MTNIGTTQYLHQLADTGLIGRREQQVDMIGHQHIAVHRDTQAATVLLQFPEIHSIVMTGKEAHMPIVATLNNVTRHPGNKMTCWARHQRIRSQVRKPFPFSLVHKTYPSESNYSDTFGSPNLAVSSMASAFLMISSTFGTMSPLPHNALVNGARHVVACPD